MEQARAGIKWLPIASSQTLTKGDFVILSSGLVTIAAANDAPLAGVIAQDCASLDASTLVPVYADPNTKFMVIADAASNGIVSGDVHDIVGSTGAMMLDVGGTTTDVLKVVRHVPCSDDNTAAYARMEVLINIHEYHPQAAA
jgi:hypothetical protein